VVVFVLVLNLHCKEVFIVLRGAFTVTFIFSAMFLCPFIPFRRHYVLLAILFGLFWKLILFLYIIFAGGFE
jgi:hypothetical protein